MADIKTNLRELSVGFYFFNQKKLGEITPKYFLNVIKENIDNTDHIEYKNIALDKNEFNKSELDIIKNGINLGKAIKENFDISEDPDIYWHGWKTQSGSVIDLEIDEIKFSLKENSFIIENMGLYKLINLLIGEDRYHFGQLHAFEDFAKEELEDWFSTTRDLIIYHLKGRNFAFVGSRYTSSMRLKDNVLEISVTYSNGTFSTAKIENFSKCGYDKFKEMTDGKTREHGFCKLINKKLSKNETYNKSKEDCSNEAGKAIIKLIEQNKGKLNNLKRFFRIEEETYYYAKTTSKGIVVYEVPAEDEFESLIEIIDLNFKVPKSQLNIYTTLRNKETKEKIKFRSEVRYTHGQLNNAPEAKSYVETGDLTVAYKGVYPK